MSNEISVINENEMIAVLTSSLYPGANINSVKLVLSYCKAAGLDPLQKSVHIVPMDMKTGNKDSEGKDIYGKRDVIMPGIGLYRVQAARTGSYAGISDPVFGPVKKIMSKVKKWNNAYQGDRSFVMVDGAEIEFPEWCKITVRRAVGAHIAEFTATEYWSENYATAGNDTTTPNAMWKRRPYGQLAKCAEAQALRKAFPEVGSQPTAEEMEGKEYEPINVTPEPEKLPVKAPGYLQASFDNGLPSWTQMILSGKQTSASIIAKISSAYVMTDAQKETLNKITKPEPTKEVDAEWVDAYTKQEQAQ